MSINSGLIILPATPLDYDLIISLIDNYPTKDFGSLYSHFIVRNLLTENEDIIGEQKKCFLIYKKEILIGFLGLAVFKNNYIYNAIWYINPLYIDNEILNSFDELIIKIAKENNIKKERRVLKSDQELLINKYLKELPFHKVSRWYSTYGSRAIINFESGNDFEIRSAVENDLEFIKQFLQKSKNFSISGQMYPKEAIFYPLDGSILKEMVRKKKVLVAYQNSKIEGVCIFNVSPVNDLFSFEILEICYFEGKENVFYQITNFLKNNSREWSLMKINTVDAEILNLLLGKSFNCEFLNEIENNLKIGGEKKYSNFLIAEVSERYLYA